MSDGRCRHNRYWIINGGYGLWCYECGAYRAMTVIKNGTTSVPRSGWIKPTGMGGENPWEGFKKSCTRYEGKYESTGN